MKYSIFCSLSLCSILSLLSFSFQASANARPYNNFRQCLSHRLSNSNSFPKLIYTPNDPSYFSVLNSTIQNRRFSPLILKPLAIITPSNVSHVQASVYCSRKHGLQIRTRSGGHDFEGLSYVSQVPFVIIDLRNLSSITIDVHGKTAWVEAGATVGQVYYRVAEKSRNLGFPAGFCHTVGVGGQFSGGGYGGMMRKYGLAADNIIDAYIVNVNGEILDRKAMGEDLFWAIRGGGAVSFGVVVAWKIRLVQVPSTVTVFDLKRELEQNQTMKLINRWQYIAHKFDEKLTIFITIRTINSTQDGKIKILPRFVSLFLGGADSLLQLMKKSFPELGLKKEDCMEMSWIKSAALFNGLPDEKLLLNRTPPFKVLSFKGKLDYVKKPVPEKVLHTMLERLYQEEVGVGAFRLFPQGGKMNKISTSKIPFPHRAGNLYEILYYVQWDPDQEGDAKAAKRHSDWARNAYNFMTPYVSKNPRGAYLNYRDLDLGKNNVNGPTSYKQASIWGNKYFGNNFKRLVRVKTKVDPTNFFRDQQSIPPFRV